MNLDAATIDRLRELGATDDMLKWLEHPEAVRELLRHQPTNEDNAACGHCDVVLLYPHLRDCPVAAAWRALGDPRGAEDIERAWSEALRQAAQMMAPARGPRGAFSVSGSPHVREGDAYVLSPDVWRVTGIAPLEIQSPWTLGAPPK